MSKTITTPVLKLIPGGSSYRSEEIFLCGGSFRELTGWPDDTRLPKMMRLHITPRAQGRWHWVFGAGDNISCRGVTATLCSSTDEWMSDNGMVSGRRFDLEMEIIRP